ncbi:hypothetical protein SAY87_024952 [Trapa incisa]|uniref:Protein WVD2-like 7 n=1 Tax=Trapa incisa TaxID=236973 RepID=A0AAN7GGQ0_9MYRT|nr:hypothetical protein SAY87_024952 [Trapa incisa]
MGETAASSAPLELSISFGRFEGELLSWEKWSSFSTNKYLEEVEKCATPGSVAEKKAYFESRYKNIAARTPEPKEPPTINQVEDCLFRSDAGLGQGVLHCSDTESDYEVRVSTGPSFARGMEQCNFDRRVEQEDMEIYDDDLITIECNGFSAEPEKVQGEQTKWEVETNLHKLEGENVVKEVHEREVIPTVAAVVASNSETQSKFLEDVNEFGDNVGSEMDCNKVPQKENGQLHSQNNAVKTSVVSKEKSMPKIRKKPSLPLAKSSQITTPKVPKAVSASSLSSASRVRSASSITKSKNLNSLSTGSGKKGAHKSLHMSVSPSLSSSPASAPTATRKSFFMESMRDKDIVKTAFKVFEISVRKLDPPMSKQVPSRKIEHRPSHSVVARKENGGAGVEATGHKDHRSSLPSFGLRSIGKPRAVPQQVKKLQEKPDAKVQIETTLQEKLEEHKEADIKTQRQGLHLKASPLPASQRQCKTKNKAHFGGFQG